MKAAKLQFNVRWELIVSRKIVRSCLAVALACAGFFSATTLNLHGVIDGSLPGTDSAGVKFLASWFVIYLVHRFWVIWGQRSKHFGNTSN